MPSDFVAVVVYLELQATRQATGNEDEQLK